MLRKEHGIVTFVILGIYDRKTNRSTHQFTDGHRELTFPITTGYVYYVYYTAKKTTYGESHVDYILTSKRKTAER